MGFPPPSGGAPDPLDGFAASAIGYVEATTGRVIDPTLPNVQPVNDWQIEVLSGGFPNIDTYGVDLDLGIVGWRATILRAVQEVVQESAAYMTTVVAQDYLESFKAGSYAEKRRDTQTILRSRGSVSNPLINTWPQLSDLLWLLLTADMFDYWMMRLGTPVPAAVFVEKDFRDQWDAPGSIPGGLPGFGPPGMGGDWPGSAGGWGT